MTDENTDHVWEGPIYVGLSGLSIPSFVVNLRNDISIKGTYAHLMAPFLMAFKPAPFGQSHPPPWKAVQGGLAFDITAEITIPESKNFNFFERLRVAHMITTLIRLTVSPGITMPVISNVQFDNPSSAPDKPARFLTLEIEPRHFPLQLHAEGQDRKVEDFAWVGEHLETALDLQKNNLAFKTAIDAINQGQFIRNLPLVHVLLWGALEGLFSPIRAELSFRTSAAVASYLYLEGNSRLKAVKRIRELYDYRSAAAHGRSKHDPEILAETYDLLRRAILKIVFEKKVPTRDELDGMLFGAIPYK